MYTIHYSLRAENDLDAVLNYGIEHYGLHAAVQFIEELRAAIELLNLMPTRCPLTPEGIGTGSDIRHLIHDRYRIIFKVKKQKVFILTIRHTSRTAGDI
jgi:plasmid stabilization system protein ParE